MAPPFRPGEDFNVGMEMGSEDEVPEIMTAEEAAKWLRMPLWSFYEMCKAGGIPHFRLGRRLRVRRTDLLAFTAARVKGGEK